MSRADDPGVDDTMRAAYAASDPLSQHLDEETWTAFFENRLEAGARETALDHVSSCARCAGVFKAARTAALAQVPRERERALPRSQWVPALALAATITVAVVSVVVLRQPVSTPAPVPTTVPSPPVAATPAPARKIDKPAVVISGEQLLTTRSNRNQTAYLEALAKALEPYQRDQFAEAARLLAPIAADHPDQFEPAFYLGASLLLDGRPREAVSSLERAETLASSARKDEATRLLSLARSAITPP